MSSVTRLEKTDVSDDQTYADVLTCAAKLLAWKAANMRTATTTGGDSLLHAAALCVRLSNEYEAKARQPTPTTRGRAA